MRKRIIYGPILSRRLGRSLGIDVIKDPQIKKNCNFDCVYCQLGHVNNKVTETEEVIGLVTPEEVVKGINSYHRNIDDLDYITFSGTCEPTMNPFLGEMIKDIKKISDHRICVISNSSLMDREDVRQNLSKVDLVVATLVSGYEDTFKAINRPAEGIRLENVINGLKKLQDAKIEGAKKKHPKLGIELMFIDSTIDFPVNHTEKEVKRLIKVLSEIKPDEIEILTVSRPPAESYIVPVSDIRLKQIASVFEEEFGKERIKLVLKGIKTNRSNMKHGNLNEEVYDLILRRPCTFSQICASLGIEKEELKPIIKLLLSSNSIKENESGKEIYYNVF